MARARRAWSTLRTEVRRLLRETTAAGSYWPDADLLDYLNHAIDLRVMQLAEQHEGWVTDTYDADLVANQGEYAIPEGTGRIKRVLIVATEGSASYEMALVRNERWSEGLYETGAAGADPGRGYRPDYRFKGEFVILSPAPTFARTNGLKFEIEGAPARIAADGDKLDLRFPDSMETLLIYDVWDLAMGVEDSQGNDDTANADG